MNLIIKSVAASMGALFWSMLLLFMIQCIVGIFIGQMVQGFIVDDSKDIDARREVYRYYGTFTKTQFTMFEVTHVNFARASRVLVDHVGETWAWFFVLYRCSVAFAFLQVIRAVFIQRTLRVADRDKELVLHNKRLAQKELHNKLQQMYSLFDQQNRGEITRDVFHKVLTEESTRIWMSALDIDASDPEGLFELLDLDGSGTITRSEFMYGGEKLRGNSSQRDMFTMQSLAERIEAKLDTLLPEVLRGKVFPCQVMERQLHQKTL